MLVFFFPFFENLGSYVYDSMRARVRLIDDLPNMGTSTRRGKRDVEKVEMTLFH